MFLVEKNYPKNTRNFNFKINWFSFFFFFPFSFLFFFFFSKSKQKRKNKLKIFWFISKNSIQNCQIMVKQLARFWQKKKKKKRKKMDRSPHNTDLIFVCLFVCFSSPKANCIRFRSFFLHPPETSACRIKLLVLYHSGLLLP